MAPHRPLTQEPEPSPTGRSAAGGSNQSRGWAFAVAIIPPAATIVIGIATARYLGAAGLGRIAFIGFVRQTLIIMLTLGLPQAVVRFTGETLGSGHGGRLHGLTRFAWRLGLPATVAGFVVLSLVGLLGGAPRWAWILAGVSCAAGVVNALASAFLTGTQRWRDAFVLGLATAVVAAACKIVVLAAGGGVTSIFVVDAVLGTIAALGTAYLARRAARSVLPPEEPVGDLNRRMIKFAAIGSGSVVINLVVYRRTELFFLERYSSDTQIALYSVPFSAIETLILLPRLVATVVGPAMATLYGAGEHERIAGAYARALRTMMPILFFVTAAGIAIGPTLLTFLYGREFHDAQVIFIILIATTPFVPLMAIAASVLFGLGKQWVPTAIGPVAAVANLGLDLVLIKNFDAVGAAFSNSIAQIIGSVPLAVYAAHCVGGVSLRLPVMARGLLGAVLAGGAAAFVVYAIPSEPIGLAAAAAVFVVIAVPAAVLLRVMSDDDAAWFRDAVPAYLSRPAVSAVRFVRMRAVRV